MKKYLYGCAFGFVLGLLAVQAQDANARFTSTGDLGGVLVEQIPAQQQEETIVKKSLEGDVQLPNAEPVKLTDEPIIHQYNGTLKLTYQEQGPLPEGTDDKFAQPAACALLTLVSDDGCTISVDGGQWLAESKKGHDISQGRRDFGKVLSPGSHAVNIEYSQVYYDPQSGNKDLDGISLVVSTIPVNIRAAGVEAMLGQHEKTLVKQNDPVYFMLAPEWRDLPCMHQDKIKWEYRPLLGKGNIDRPYGEWKPMGDHAKGTRFMHKWTEPGIFQIRAIVGDVPFTFVRSMDIKYRFNSGGSENAYLKKGMPNFVGVVRNSEELAVAKTAASNLGKTEWAKAVKAPERYDFNVGLFESYEDSWKCNMFVYGMAYDSGLPMSLMDKNPFNCPPTCSRLYDSTYSISRNHLFQADIYTVIWKWLNGESLPVPGNVITTKGHTGIIDYDGTWINAGEINVNKYIHISQENSNPKSRYGEFHYRQPVKK